MFTPKNIQNRKRSHRAHIIQKMINPVEFPFLKAGVVGLKLLDFGFLFPKQLQAIFSLLNKLLKKKATIHIYAFPRGSLTTKKAGARMGKGKGKVLSSWVFKALAGFILCEIHTTNVALAIKALKCAQYKLPVASVIVTNSFKKKDF